MKIYRGFPRRLHHTVPHWVEPGALFHIRIALDREKEQRALTDPALAQVRHGESVLWRTIFDSAKFYEAKVRWHITLFLVMPDHLHALLSFARNESMSEVIRDWKRFHARTNGVIWQEGYFDHRLRADERGEQLSVKLNYIRQNPVAAGLCAKSEEWPWVIDPFGRALRWIGFSEDDVKTIAEGARFALPEHRAHQKSGGKAAFNFNNALRTTRSLRALNEVDRLLRRRCLLPRAREQGNRITPGDVQVFEKKIQISFKKSVDTISHVQLKRELLPRTTRKNKKSKKSKKSIDIILALLLQAMLPAPLPGPKFYPHQP